MLLRFPFRIPHDDDTSSIGSADPADALIPDSARVHDQTLTRYDTTTWKSGLTATLWQLHQR